MRNPSRHILAIQNGDIDDPADLDNARADLHEAARYADPQASLATGHVSEYDRFPQTFGRTDDDDYNFADRYDELTGVWYRRAADSDDWYALS